MTSDSERLKALWLQKATCSQKEFGRRWGIGTHGMVSQYLNGKTPLNLGAVIKFARGLGVALSDISPTLAQEVMEAAALVRDGFAPAPPRGRAVPLVPLAMAGLPGGPDDDRGESVLTETAGERLFALRVEGESMFPDLRPGDVILVDPDTSPQPGDIVVARTKSPAEATIKRYALRGFDETGREIFELLSSNPLYPALRASDRMPIFIVGVVIERRTFRLRRA